MEKRYAVKLDLFEINTVKTPYKYSKMEFVQGDEDCYIDMFLLSDGEPYIIPDGAMVSVNFSFAPYTKVLYKGLASVADALKGKATYAIVGQEISIPGEVLCTVEVNAGGDRLTWQPFTYTVVKSFTSIAPTPPSAMSPWTDQMMEIVQGIQESIEEAGGVPGPEGEQGTVWFTILSNTPEAPDNARVGDYLLNGSDAPVMVGEGLLNQGSYGVIQSLSPLLVSPIGSLQGPPGQDGGVAEAPNDGKLYVRQSEGWVEVQFTLGSF